MGEALVRYIISQTDHHVINVDKLAYAVTLDPLTETMDHLRHHFQKVDICHAQAIEELLAHYQPDAIMHLAAETHVDCSIDDSADFIQNNIVGAFSLLKSTRKNWLGLSIESRQRFRFNHISTDEVYGGLGETEVRYAIDVGNIARELGWVPEVTFESGIKNTTLWYLENHPWCQAVQSGNYQRQRLSIESK